MARARNRWQASSRAAGGKSGRVCSRRWMRRPRRKRRPWSGPRGERTDGSSPAGRDGARGCGGAGSGGGGEPAQSGRGSSAGAGAFGRAASAARCAEVRRQHLGGLRPGARGQERLLDLRRHRRQGVTHQIVPATRGHPLAGAPAADIEPVLGPRHGHVQQAAVLVVADGVRRRPGRRRRLVAVALVGRPQHQLPALGPEQGRARGPRHLHSVGQDHDRRLQALGPMHGHHPHRAPALLQVALHLRLAGGEPMQEALQRRRVGALVGQGQGQKLIDGVVGLGP